MAGEGVVAILVESIQNDRSSSIMDFRLLKLMIQSPESVISCKCLRESDALTALGSKGREPGPTLALRQAQGSLLPGL